MSEEPKPCPFCGIEPKVIAFHIDTMITCSNGCLTFDIHSTEEETVAAWNRLAVVPEGWKVVPEEPTERWELNLIATTGMPPKWAHGAIASVLEEAPTLGNTAPDPQED